MSVKNNNKKSPKKSIGSTPRKSPKKTEFLGEDSFKMTPRQSEILQSFQDIWAKNLETYVDIENHLIALQTQKKRIYDNLVFTVDEMLKTSFLFLDRRIDESYKKRIWTNKGKIDISIKGKKLTLKVLK